MAGNSFGKLFKLTTFGESHGEAIGGIIDGDFDDSFRQALGQFDRLLRGDHVQANS